MRQIIICVSVFISVLLFGKTPSGRITIVRAEQTDTIKQKKFVVVLDTQALTVKRVVEPIAPLANSNRQDVYLVKYLAIHCTATPPSNPLTDIAKVEWWRHHRGWNKWGYHVIFHRDGRMEILNPTFKLDEVMHKNEIVNGVKGINRHCISIAYVGGVADQPVYDQHRQAYRLVAEDNLTEAQLYALRGFILAVKTAVPNILIAGHRDFRKMLKQPYKDCPSFEVMDKFGDLIGEAFLPI